MKFPENDYRQVIRRGGSAIRWYGPNSIREEGVPMPPGVVFEKILWQ